MKLLWAYILVFLLAAAPFLEAYGVVPLATIAGLSVIPVMILGVIGNILTVLLVILFINQIKNWRKKGMEAKKSKRSQRAQNLWKKYGLPGLAMFGPLLVGSHLTALASMSFGGTKRKTFFWMSASITTWSIVFTVLLFLGVDFLGLEDRAVINYFKTIE